MLKFYSLLILCSLLTGVTVLQDNTDPRTRHFPKKEVMPESLPEKENLWVFIMAGQSNMAGRGQVEPQDTVATERVLSINKEGDITLAKEPLHFYEPELTGLDSGLSFGRELTRHLPESISVLILPTAVGGSSISQWLNDETFRDVRLLSNFREKMAIGKEVGQIRGILWHQGESDANPEDIPHYEERLEQLFNRFRQITVEAELPIVAGELGSFSTKPEEWEAINEQLRRYAEQDLHMTVVPTGDLKDKGDRVHFDSEGQRTLGKRYAEAWLNNF